MTTFFTSSERSTEEWQVIVTVRDIPSANVEAPRSATVAARMGAGLDVMSTAAIPAVRGTTARRRQVAEAVGSSSQLTPRWREMDSNPRSPVREIHVRHWLQIGA
jgi:hypothetical protein